MCYEDSYKIAKLMIIIDGYDFRYGIAMVAKEYILPRLGLFGGDAAKKLDDLNSSLVLFQTTQDEQ